MPAQIPRSRQNWVVIFNYLAISIIHLHHASDISSHHSSTKIFSFMLSIFYNIGVHISINLHWGSSRDFGVLCYLQNGLIVCFSVLLFPFFSFSFFFAISFSSLNISKKGFEEEL